MKQDNKVLIVDDEARIRKIFSKILGNEGYLVDTAENGLKALELIQTYDPGVVLLDQNMPGMDGLNTLKKIKERSPYTEVVIITAHGEVNLAVEAIKNGAYDYIEKPVDNQKLIILVERAMNHYQMATEITYLKKQLTKKDDFNKIIGTSKPMQQAIAQAKDVCETEATVLISGESGTGKELFAKAIHYCSERANGPIISVNCGAIPLSLIESELFGHEKGAFTDAKEAKPGKFEQANGGTLFLDEIGELPIDAQVKLLRVLEERKVTRLGGKKAIQLDVRIISATNRNLEERVQSGDFRLDLLYRLNIFTLHLPPLRERYEDIPLLAEFFINQFNDQLACEVKNISDQAMNLLRKYSWPGNIRDLQNAIQSSMILCKKGSIKKEHLPMRIKGFETDSNDDSETVAGLDVNIKKINAIAEKEIIVDALDKCRYNRTETAKMLKISRKTLFNKMKNYDL